MAVIVRLTSSALIVFASWVAQTTTISPPGPLWTPKAPITICELNFKSCSALSGVLGPHTEE